MGDDQRIYFKNPRRSASELNFTNLDDLLSEQFGEEQNRSFYDPSEVAECFDISVQRVRGWDTIGLLKPSYREEGRFRKYTRTDMFRFAILTDLLKRKDSVHFLKKMEGAVREALFLVGAKAYAFAGGHRKPQGLILKGQYGPHVYFIDLASYRRPKVR